MYPYTLILMSLQSFCRRYDFHYSDVYAVNNNNKLEWLSRDNLTSPLFVLVTCRHMNIRQKPNNIMLRQQIVFFLYLWTQNFSYDITLDNDHFIVWPSSVTLTFNLPFKWTTVPKYFEIHACMYMKLWADDHYIIWPLSVTLTVNLPEQMFQMAFLLLKENSWAKSFWEPCIYVQAMARTSSIYDYSIIWPSVALTFNLPEQMFQMTLLLLKENNCA